MTGPVAIFGRMRQSAAAGLRRERPLVATARAFKGAVALEPGGPSPLFGARGLVPVYPQLAVLDTLDFSRETLWSEEQAASSEIRPRRRLVAEAGDLAALPARAYDVLLASHVIEHIANPLGALAAWRRVVKPGGHLLLVVPHRDGTFDHRRPITTLAHLRADAEAEVAEDDATHLGEVLELHDLARDPGAPSRAVFEQRCRENAHTRAMHHHVFVSRTVIEMCGAASLRVLLLVPRRPHDIVCLCALDGERRIGEPELASTLRRSPFPSDRAGT